MTPNEIILLVCILAGTLALLGLWTWAHHTGYTERKNEEFAHALWLIATLFPNLCLQEAEGSHQDETTKGFINALQHAFWGYVPFSPCMPERADVVLEINISKPKPPSSLYRIRLNLRLADQGHRVLGTVETSWSCAEHLGEFDVQCLLLRLSASIYCPKERNSRLNERLIDRVYNILDGQVNYSLPYHERIP